MAVQKSRRSRATRGARRSHDKLSNPSLSIDAESGEIHRRHQITPNGYYRGRQVIMAAVPKTDDEEE